METIHQVLTSASRGIRVDSWEIEGSTVDTLCPVPWAVRKRTLHGGLQEGVDVVEVEAGDVRFTVVPTRGMGVLRAEAAGTRLGWDSPVREVVHPAFVNLHDRGGLGFLEGFNEWIARCGLEWAGGPGRDEFTNNVGDRAEMDLTVHGRIANLPASEVEVLVEPGPGGAGTTIRIRGRVDERTFFGPKLELLAEVSVTVGSRTIRIDDAITNRGSAPQEFQVIYHANYGPPLLERGARFAGAIERVIPINDRAARAAERWAEQEGPTAGAVETVYCLKPYGDETGRTRILLRNAAGDRAASMDFLLRELPCAALWKNPAALEDGYVTGLEPSTGFPNNRRIERMRGRVPVLRPGETRTFGIAVSVHAGKEEVARAEGEIERIRAGRPTRVDREPEK